VFGAIGHFSSAFVLNDYWTLSSGVLVILSNGQRLMPYRPSVPKSHKYFKFLALSFKSVQKLEVQNIYVILGHLDGEALTFDHWKRSLGYLYCPVVAQNECGLIKCPLDIL